MGFFSSLFGLDAGSRAAAAKVKESRRSERQIRGALDPFLQAGQGQLGALTEGTTAGGLDERLGRIFDTDIFGRLVGERTEALRGQLGAAGLQRSGTALERVAAVPTDLGLQIEELLSGRSRGLAGQGLQAGGALAGAFERGGQFRGGAISQGILSDAQAQSSLISQILGGLGGGIAGFTGQGGSALKGLQGTLSGFRA